MSKLQADPLTSKPMLNTPSQRHLGDALQRSGLPLRFFSGCLAKTGRMLTVCFAVRKDFTDLLLIEEIKFNQIACSSRVCKSQNRMTRSNEGVVYGRSQNTGCSCKSISMITNDQVNLSSFCIPVTMIRIVFQPYVYINVRDNLL